MQPKTSQTSTWKPAEKRAAPATASRFQALRSTTPPMSSSSDALLQTHPPATPAKIHRPTIFSSTAGFFRILFHSDRPKLFRRIVEQLAERAALAARTRSCRRVATAPIAGAAAAAAARGQAQATTRREDFCIVKAAKRHPLWGEIDTILLEVKRFRPKCTDLPKGGNSWHQFLL